MMTTVADAFSAADLTFQHPELPQYSDYDGAMSSICRAAVMDHKAGFITNSEAIAYIKRIGRDALALQPTNPNKGI